MEQEVRLQLIGIITYITSLLSLSNPLTIKVFEKVNSIPRVGDMWILMATSSPFHCVRFFISKIDVLFVVGEWMNFSGERSLRMFMTGWKDWKWWQKVRELMNKKCSRLEG